MKKIVMLVSIVLLMQSSFVKANSKSINWIHSYEDGLKMSKLLNKPILLDFTALWCGPCRKMDRDVWSKEDVKLIMNNFVPVKVDFDTEKELVRKYSVKGIPYIFIIDAWGSELYSFIGYRDEIQTLKILKNFSINMSSIYQALTILEKSKDNLYSNLRVAQKFQNVAFMLTDDSKKSFLKRSNKYLRESESLAKNSEKKVKEKIALLHLLNKAYNKSYKSVLKKLPKEFKEVDKSNKCLYNYIEFYCNQLQGNTVEAEKYYQLITGSYKQKADFILKV
ncbi:Thioredoxin-like [Lutibacter oricola]|uniref:Thioredoxin-like n=1 Tax=Lutibacter oricola TaxID=762486 RepID=A0A1H3AMG8_9FLAO|nr:thioredoxin family protein [Lutibacter oricola]SDX30876.1 Thioredoxin-like [Lutibacter oricola]